MQVTVEPPHSPLRRLLAPVTVALIAAAAAVLVWLAVRGSSSPAHLSEPDTPAPSAGTAAPPSSTVAPVLPDGPVAAVDLTTTTVAPSTTAAPPPTEPPTTEPPTTEPPTTTTPEQDTVAIAALQTRLADLGYSVGPADGKLGARTASAVLAFEKVEGLDRDGEPGPAVYARLDDPQGSVAAGGDAVPRVEIDLERQVLFVVTAEGTRIFNTSTGNNEPFEWPDGTPATAYTPTGEFSVLRRVDGIDDGPLGSLYRPLYFYDGWAIHGSSYVPAYPASHGCARVSNEDQNWIWDHVANGTPVIVY